jgi:hypothetical protein
LYASTSSISVLTISANGGAPLVGRCDECPDARLDALDDTWWRSLTVEFELAPSAVRAAKGWGALSPPPPRLRLLLLLPGGLEGEEKWAAMVWREGDLEKEGAREPATLPPKLEPFEVRLVRPAEREVKVE